ncbi:hypothetical protein H9P43_001335 [Blastocladiella emersonii ATCC 22665]|nr:hypothetical protein H9P43_001335 [Blastocladiella emersonii ATCC 22665]
MRTTTLILNALLLLALLAPRLAAATPYPSTNPLDRILHALRNSVNNRESDDAPSSFLGDGDAAGAPKAKATTTVTVYLPRPTDLDGRESDRAPADTLSGFDHIPQFVQTTTRTKARFVLPSFDDDGEDLASFSTAPRYVRAAAASGEMHLEDAADHDGHRLFQLEDGVEEATIDLADLLDSPTDFALDARQFVVADTLEEVEAI